ncbi:MAG: IS66 family transposase [Spirochaetaceae bacterium]|jgi:transposase|nr:IS66 family transposase [Spirochaetaceae bacterium]
MDREQELLEKIKQLELRLNKIEKVNDEKDKKITWLMELVQSLQILLFGPKSEKLTKEDLLYLSLFNEAEDGAFEQKMDPPGDDQVTDVKSFKRNKRGISITSALPDDFPSREIIYNLKGDECHCGCGTRLKHIGYVITKRLEIKPAEFTVLIEKREKGACPDCDGIDLNEDDSPAIRTAKGKKHLIPGGIATSGLIAWSLAEKFEFAVPFYRQEKRFQYIGVKLSRANLCNWAVKAGEACSPLISLIEKHIKSGPVINADETPFQVLREKDREAQKKSWMWLFKGGPPENPAILFQYNSSRSSTVPKAFLTGFEGWLQTDDYGAYHSALKSLNTGRSDDRKIHHL